MKMSDMTDPLSLSPKTLILPLVACLVLGIMLMDVSQAAAQINKVGIWRSGSQPGHYLEWNGTPMLLVGDSVTQGWMETGTNFDQEGYVDALASRGINLLMIWSYMGTSSATQVGDTRIAYDAPEIWPWVGSPDDSSFDLTQLNQAYFERLSDLVAYAETKGIVVLICIHEGWTKSRFDGHPFNALLGNGPLDERQEYMEFADYNAEMPETYNPSWDKYQQNQYFQERFCDKLIVELDGYSNVIYEMCNEGDWYDDWYGRTLRNSYEQHFLSFFRARCDNLLLTNTDHVPGDDPHNDSKVDVVTLHGDWTNRFNDFQSGFWATPARPYLMSEPVPGWDGVNNSLETIRRSMWEVSMAGSGWVNQNDPSFGWDPYAAIASQTSVRNQAYDYAGHCARFFNSSGVGFSQMAPQGGLSSTGICLAEPGVQYVVYSPTGGTFTIDLSAVDGGSTCTVDWYDPRTGDFVSQESVQGGSVQTLEAPGNSDWVVLISADEPVASTTPTPLLTQLALVDHNYAYSGEDWSNVIDGDTDGWDGTVTAQDSPPWAIFKFADGATKTISEIRLMTDTGVGYSDRWVKRFTVQVSTTGTDPSSFVTVLDHVSKSGGDWEEYTIDPAHARYIKLIVDEPGWGWRQIGEFEVYASDGGSSEPPSALPGEPANDAPQANNSTVTTVADMPVTGRLGASDPDGDPLDYALVSEGSLGVVTLTDPTTGDYIYEPYAGATGTDTFTFLANDGDLDSNAATVTVVIDPEQTGEPVLAELGLVDHNYAYPGEDWSNVIDGDTDGWDGTVTAQDSPPWAIFKFADGATKTISEIRLMTDTGVGYSDRWVKRFTVQVSTTGTDPSSFVTVLDHVSKSGGSWQAYTIDPTTARYIKLMIDEPGWGWRQIGEFEVHAGDGGSSEPPSPPTGEPANEAPQAYDSTVTTVTDTAVTGRLGASDSDGDSLAYMIISDGSLGVVTLTDAETGDYIYEPYFGETGTDTFTFVANDGDLDSNAATVTVVIDPEQTGEPVLAELTLVDHNYAYPGEDWSHAVDGDTDGWDGTVTAQDSPPWAIFEFVDGSTKVVSEFGLLTDTGVGYSDRWVRRFSIQVSTTGTDPSNFVTVLDQVSKSGGDWETYTIDPTNARYIKLMIDEPAWGWRQIGEFEVYAVE